MFIYQIYNSCYQQALSSFNLTKNPGKNQVT